MLGGNKSILLSQDPGRLPQVTSLCFHGLRVSDSTPAVGVERSSLTNDNTSDVTSILHLRVDRGLSPEASWRQHESLCLADLELAFMALLGGLHHCFTAEAASTQTWTDLPRRPQLPASQGSSDG